MGLEVGPERTSVLYEGTEILHIPSRKIGVSKGVIEAPRSTVDVRVSLAHVEMY